MGGAVVIGDHWLPCEDCDGSGRRCLCNPRDPELAAYRRGNYAECASQIALFERISVRGCTHGGGCDLDYACWRHRSVLSIAERYRSLTVYATPPK